MADDSDSEEALIVHQARDRGISQKSRSLAPTFIPPSQTTSTQFEDINVEEFKDIPSDALELLKSGCTFQEFVEKYPECVVTVLDKLGYTKLGTFVESDFIVNNAFSRDTMVVRGGDGGKESTWVADWHDFFESKIPNNKEGLSSIMRQNVKLGAFVVNLKDIADPEKGNLIELLLKKEREGGLSRRVWELSSVQAVVTYHWKNWARSLMAAIVLAYCIWAISLAVYSYSYIESPGGFINNNSTEPYDGVINGVGSEYVGINAHKSAPHKPIGGGSGEAGEVEMKNVSEVCHNRTKRIYGTFTCKPTYATITHITNIICFACACPFAIEELITVFTEGWMWFSVKNLFDSAALGIQMFIFVCHITNNFLTSQNFGSLLAFQIVLVYIRMLRFVRILGEGTTFFDAAMSVIYSVRYWLVYIIFTAFTASLAFGVMYKADTVFNEKAPDFRTFRNSLVSTYQIAFGNFDLKYIFYSSYEWFHIVAFFGFEVLMTVTTLNLLIAAMSEAYSEVSKIKTIQFYRGRASVINEMMSLNINRLSLIDKPAYIHFSVVEERSLEEASPGSEQLIKDLQKEVRDLSAKIDKLMELAAKPDV